MTSAKVSCRSLHERIDIKLIEMRRTHRLKRPVIEKELAMN